MKNPSIFFETTQIFNALRIFTISVAFYGKFATFKRFLKIQDFFSKNPSIFFFKNPTPQLERFEKSYYFSCILRQIWWKNFTTFSKVSDHRKRNWQTAGKKRFSLNGRFFSHITKWRKIISTCSVYLCSTNHSNNCLKLQRVFFSENWKFYSSFLLIS